MPEMDGIELLRHLADRKFNGGIILVSAEEGRLLQASVELGRAQQLKVLGALAKPVKCQGVLDRLQTLYMEQVVPGQDAALMITAQQLKRAIRNHEITVYFQPKVDTNTLALRGVEALARWRHPEIGVISPDKFITLAENNNLIDALTDVVIEEAIRLFGAWHGRDPDLQLGINLSMDTVQRFKLPEYILAQAVRHDVNPQQIMLEVSENRIAHNMAASLESLTRLRLMGMGLSIDDFGTGYSTMEQMKRIPFVELKIDRAFVHGANRDPAARAILESSIELAKKLRMQIVAEGVEDDEDSALTKALGCDCLQGYVIAQPMPADELPGWVEQWRERLPH
jgi:EAL domain-containing protein (putative c-di-GMP-specific phosphodiesterase class I)